MTATRLERVGYFHGRFQPFHLGHLEVVQRALRTCTLVVIGISNPFRLPPVVPHDYSRVECERLGHARSDAANPWPYWARVFMIREGLMRERIACDRIIFIPNLNNSGLPVDEVRFPKSVTTVFLCPKDEHNRAIARKYREDQWEVVEVPLSSVCPGSGTIREKMRTNTDWKGFVPAGTAAALDELRARFDLPTRSWFHG